MNQRHAVGPLPYALLLFLACNNPSRTTTPPRDAATPPEDAMAAGNSDLEIDAGDTPIAGSPETAGAGGAQAGATGEGGAGAPAADGGRQGPPPASAGGRAGAAGPAGAGGTAATSPTLPSAGNPDGRCQIPAEAALEDVSQPTTVVGTGTPESCTSEAFVAAVARGGVITFHCGDAPATIELKATAKVFNDKAPKLVIDGGGKITLSGGDKVRILYQNTCDPELVWTSSSCEDQATPELTVQNLTFVRGRAIAQAEPGGGAIFARGGRFKILHSRFFNNRCDDTGPTVGGAAVRVLDQYQDEPVYVVDSTFGGHEDLGNVCSNGGALSSINASFSVFNSAFSYNEAIGNGANPPDDGTPGGGSGGAIHGDGSTGTLNVCGALIEHNHANANGGAIFFSSSLGSLIIRDSTLRANPNLSRETEGFPGVFVDDADDKPSVTNSIILR